MLERRPTEFDPVARAAAAVEVRLSAGAEAACAIDATAAHADPVHAYLRAAWFAAGGEAVSTLCIERPDGRPLAALPTVPVRGGLRLLRAVPGCYWPYRSVPVSLDATPAELEAGLAHPLARQALGPVWRLGPARADDAALLRLLPAAQAAGWTLLSRRLGTSWVLELDRVRAAGRWPRGSTLRKNRWFEKELAREGPLSVRVASGADWTSGVFDTLAEVERNSWVGQCTDWSAAKFLGVRQRGYWQAAASDPALAAVMRAAILFIGDIPAAFSFELDCGDTCYVIANSFDRRFARHSPGRVLAYRSFETLEVRGIARLDWGAGDPGYKRTMGAEAGAAILDCLFVRSPAAARLLRPVWRA